VSEFLFSGADMKFFSYFAGVCTNTAILPWVLRESVPNIWSDLVYGL